MMPPNARGRPPRSGDRPPENAPASANVQVLTLAPAGRWAPQAEAYSLAALPAHLAAPIVIDPQTGEWIWTGRLDKDGYGRYGSQGVHRLVYVELVGPIPAGREIDHVRAWGCTSRACCSPWHLEPCSSLENCMRGSSFAAVNAAKEECVHGHPFDLFNCYFRPNGHRDCRICTARRQREYQQRRRSRQHPVPVLARAA